VISQQNLAGENRVRPVAARTLLAARRGASTSGRPPSKSAASAVQAMAEAGQRYESWDDLDDPAGLDTTCAGAICDDIDRRVRQLIDELVLSSTA
jgi:hypothetical protein